MTNINVYDATGEIVNVIEIDDTLTFVSGRVSKGKSSYYKGLGIPYHSQHMLVEDITDQYEVIQENPVFYMGYEVINKAYVGKTGIFQEKFQPQFTDFIGTCGVKELSIIEHSIEFERSSVDVLKSHMHDDINHQYYFQVNYRCGRVEYLTRGRPKRLYELLDYMIREDWNFIWDKNTISDISHNGMVTDVADIFRSRRLKHKLGTVYSVLYSLANSNFDKYLEFIRYLKLSHTHSVHFVTNSIEILKRSGVDVKELLVSRDTIKNYQHAVYNHLIEGRNCGHCCYIELGEQITEQYRQNTAKQLNMEI